MKSQKITRALKSLDTVEENGKRYINGFIPYNSKSQRMSLGYSDCQYEMLMPSVFNKTLADKSNVYANFSHDSNKILGSTKAGTLELENTETGLKCRCLVPDTSWGNDAWEIINRGDVTTMSFEFYVYDWVEEDGISLLRSAKLEAVSFAVAEPAYTETESFAETISERGINDMEKIRRAIENKELDLSNAEILEQVKRLLEEIKAALPAEKKADEEKQPEENIAEPKENEKAEEPKVETPEQPKDDTPAEDTESKEPEVDPEQQKKLDELRKEIEKELSDNE